MHICTSWFDLTYEVISTRQCYWCMLYVKLYVSSFRKYYIHAIFAHTHSHRYVRTFQTDSLDSLNYTSNRKRLWKHVLFSYILFWPIKCQCVCVSKTGIEWTDKQKSFRLIFMKWWDSIFYRRWSKIWCVCFDSETLTCKLTLTSREHYDSRIYF